MAKRQDLDTTFQFFNEIGIINQLASNAFEAELPLGLTVSQFGVLNWFTRVDNEATPGRLATAFNVTKGAMTNTLKRLEQKGFIEVRVDQTSARRKLVTMTPLGADARRQALEAVAPLLQEMLGEFSLQDIQRSLPFLAQLRVYLDERRYQK